MDDCVFCRIAKGEIKHGVVYEDDKTIAFLDVRPAGKDGGHTLVIPKEHHEMITDIPDEDLAAVARTVKMVAGAILKLSPGVNVLQNNGSSAGQAVMHAHFHVIPRREGDGIEIEKWEPREFSPEEMEATAEKMKTLLKDK